jgi:hypothetical protein
MVKAYLEFDPRYDRDSINRERKELERKQRSKVYDVTAWSPAHAFDLDAYWCDALDVQKTRVSELPAREKGVVSIARQGEPIYAWVVDGVDDASVVFAAQAMELGLQVEIGDEAFTLFDGQATKGADGKPSRIAPESTPSGDAKASKGDAGAAKTDSSGAKADASGPKADASGLKADASGPKADASTGRRFSRGSVIVRRHENGADVAEKVAKAADMSGARVFATGTARSHDAGPDLGGQHFRLLARPRVAVLSNAPVETDSFGHVWHMLDVHLGVPCALLDAQQLGSYDLRRYNVIVLPEGEIAAILKENADTLRTWVKGGGTLVALGGSAAAVADKELKLTAVKLRDDALEDLEKIAVSVKREREAGKRPVDEAELWGDGKPASAKEGEKPGAKPGEKPAGEKPATEKPAAAEKPGTEATAKSDTKSHDKEKEGDKEKADEDSDKKRRERWLRTFSPRGVILRGEVNTDSWLAVGCNDELPVLVEGSSVFESELPVHTVVRLAASDRLRLSGLLWPEARERLADSAYATVESQGAGQVILFAQSPAFRDWFKGSERLLMNAVVYGPGAGASQPVGW